MDNNYVDQSSAWELASLCSSWLAHPSILSDVNYRTYLVSKYRKLTETFTFYMPFISARWLLLPECPLFHFKADAIGILAGVSPAATNWCLPNAEEDLRITNASFRLLFLYGSFRFYLQNIVFDHAMVSLWSDNAEYLNADWLKEVSAKGFWLLLV